MSEMIKRKVAVCNFCSFPLTPSEVLKGRGRCDICDEAIQDEQREDRHFDLEVTGQVSKENMDRIIEGVDGDTRVGEE